MASLCSSTLIRRSIWSFKVTTRARFSTGGSSLHPAIRSYSSSYPLPKTEQTFSKFQYPAAKEAPEVTRTLASQVTDADHAKPSKPPSKGGGDGDGDGGENNDNGKVSAVTEDILRHYDRHGLSQREIDLIRQSQREQLSRKKLNPRLTPGDSIPPEVPLDLIQRTLSASPQAQLTQLDNGIRVVSREVSTSPLACSVAVISDVGSRNEIHPKQRGVCALLEFLAFSTPTPKIPNPDSFLSIDLGGAAAFCGVGREQTLHTLEVIRPNVDQAFFLLAQSLLEPQWTDEQIVMAKQALGVAAEEAQPGVLLFEGMHSAAFGVDQQLGQSRAYLQDNPELNAAALAEFWQSQFINNPKSLVFAAAGMPHQQLVDLVQHHFGHLHQVTPFTGSAPFIPSQYRGGQVHIEKDNEEGLVFLGLGLQIEGWHSKDVVPVCVLQTLLGGGSSFSAGGPGKGMYSRVYRKVLNKHSWAESAEAFVAPYSDIGLFGLWGSTKPDRAWDMMVVFAENLKRLGQIPVEDEELYRARNMLRANVLMQLESRLVLLEDLGKQVLTFGHLEEASKTCERIEAVTAEDILQVAQKALKAGPPTVVTLGPKMIKIPPYEQITGWLK